MVCLPNLFKPLLFLLIIFASTAFSSKNITIHEDKIVFGAGCFWSVEKKFAELPGVINVESGYADGIGLEPRYSEITKFKNKFNPDNFAEVVEVTYDRNSISLTDLIKFFFELHDPTQKNRQGNDIGTQYRSLILFNDQSEEMLSIELKDEYQIAAKQRRLWRYSHKYKEIKKVLSCRRISSRLLS